MLPQHWPDPDYCYLESVIGVKPRQPHQMADSTNPILGGHVIQLVPPLSDTENYWGFQGYSPFQRLASILIPVLPTFAGTIFVPWYSEAL